MPAEEELNAKFAELVVSAGMLGRASHGSCVSYMVVQCGEREVYAVAQQKCEPNYSQFHRASPSSETNSCSARWEIIRLLCNQNVHFRVHNILLLVAILNSLNPLPTLPHYLFNIQFNIILLYVPRSWKELRPFSIVYIFLISHIHSLRIPCPAQLNLVITIDAVWSSYEVWGSDSSDYWWVLSPQMWRL
jgi:hypothetical protein